MENWLAGRCNYSGEVSCRSFQLLFHSKTLNLFVQKVKVKCKTSLFSSFDLFFFYL